MCGMYISFEQKVLHFIRQSPCERFFKPGVNGNVETLPLTPVVVSNGNGQNSTPRTI